jgi:predicted XRE-type DNA-binding protein
MAQNFQVLQAKMSPESLARSEAQAERLIQGMALDELRAARVLTQEHLSTLLGVKQSAISKLERRADMYVSTLDDGASTGRQDGRPTGVWVARSSRYGVCCSWY